MSETWQDYLAVWRGCFDDELALRVGCRIALIVIHGCMGMMLFYILLIIECLRGHCR